VREAVLKCIIKTNPVILGGENDIFEGRKLTPPPEITKYFN
jgi:hypothetical protein